MKVFVPGTCQCMLCQLAEWQRTVNEAERSGARHDVRLLVGRHHEGQIQMHVNNSDIEVTHYLQHDG